MQKKKEFLSEIGDIVNKQQEKRTSRVVPRGSKLIIVCSLLSDNIFLMFGVFVAESPPLDIGEEATQKYFLPLPKEGVCFNPGKAVHTRNR